MTSFCAFLVKFSTNPHLVLIITSDLMKSLRIVDMKKAPK